MVNYSNIFVKEGISYSGYRALISLLLEDSKTTGSDHNEAMLNYSKLNVQRMRRIDKTAVLSEALMNAVASIKNHYRLLVISEGWCGDAAQTVPLFQKITELAPEKFELRLVLRDTHLALIDAHLTNGGRSIPKLLILDREGGLLAEWGPRAQNLQALLAIWKKEISDSFKIAEKLHHWYAKDKTFTTQEEITHILKTLK